MLDKPIYLTRGSNRSLQFRGLQNVYVWMHEPCLEICPQIDMFELDFKNIYDNLKDILYGNNVKYNFLYRSENDINSEFGNKLVRNNDGIDIPQILIDMYYDYDLSSNILVNSNYDKRLKFYHEVHGSGRKVGFRPVNVGDFFGYDNQISHVIWNIVKDDFGDIPFEDWDKYEKEIPWWKFCKKLNLKMEIDR